MKLLSLITIAMGIVTTLSQPNIISSPPGEMMACSAANLGLEIPDDGSARTRLETRALAGMLVRGVKIEVDLAHTYLGELVITVTNEDTQTSVLLFDRDCTDNDDIHILFTDAAERGVRCNRRNRGRTFLPEESLAVFDGLDASAMWTLAIQDTLQADIGVLNQWCITFKLVNNAYRYMVLPEAVPSWDDARRACKEEFNTDLAVIISRAQNREARDMCQDLCVDNSCNGCWFGLTDRRQGDIFGWIDGSRMSFSDFGAPNNRLGTSNNECGYLRKSQNFRWDRIACDTGRLYPLCLNPDSSIRFPMYPNVHYLLDDL